MSTNDLTKKVGSTTNLVGVSTSSVDESTNSSVSTSRRVDKAFIKDVFKLQRGDIAPILLFILIFVSGMVAGLVAFFTLQNGEYNQAVAGLNTQRDLYMQSLNLASARVMKSSYVISSFIQTQPTGNVNWQSQLVPFINSGGALFEFITTVAYVRYCADENRQTFIDTYRNSSSWYSSFYFFQKVNGKTVASPTAPYYYINVGVVPTENYQNVVGLNFMGDQPRRTAIANAIATKKIAATPKTTLARVGGDTIGMLCLAPLYQNASNPNMTTGFTMTSILPINLIQSALGNITDVLMVSMYDDTPDVANDTSLNFIWGSTQSLIITNASATVDQAQIKAAPFQAIGRFPLADRTMRVVFLPTQRFMDSFTGQTKWIALIVSLVIMLILDTLCVVWYFMLRLRRSRVARAMQQHRFHVLQDSHEKQGAMLVRFMEQERINRTTLDAVSEIIIACTYDGLIVHTNAAFEKHFPKESSATQVYASSLFEGVDSHFFRNQTESQNIQMVAGRYTDNELRTNATVTVRPLFDNEYNPADNEKASYLIVAKKLDKT